MFETDDDDFTPNSSSNLASIFNTSDSSEYNKSLKYKAPKQPKPPNGANMVHPPDPEVTSKSKSSVILAGVITLWTIQNGKNSSLGRHMVALIGNSDENYTEMIIYQDKTQILIRQAVNESLVVYKYPNNCIGMYDLKKQFWNLIFTSKDNFDAFCLEIAKHKSQITEIKSPDKKSSNAENENSISGANSKVNSLPSADNKIANNNGESPNKDNILSRITKVGQQILSKGTTEKITSTEMSDSETESSQSDSKMSKPAAAPRKFKRNQNLHNEKALVMPESNNMFYGTTNTNQLLVNSHSWGYSQPYIDHGVNNFLVAQNAEMKANLAEINMKLNQVLLSKNAHMDSNGNEEEIRGLKSTIKCLNLKIENLTSDLHKSTREINGLREMYKEKCYEVNKEKEKSELMENLESELNSLRERVAMNETLEIDLSFLRQQNIEKDLVIEAQKQKLNELEIRTKDYEQLKADLNDQINNLNKLLKEAQEDKAPGNSFPNPQLDKEKLKALVKENMNEAFRGIMDNFDEDVNYTFNDVKKVVLENLKKSTLRITKGIELELEDF